MTEAIGPSRSILTRHQAEVTAGALDALETIRIVHPRPSRPLLFAARLRVWSAVVAPGKPIKSFRGSWQTACRKAGVPGRLVHDLRRTAVRNLERAGVPRSVAMKLTGHKTESVYRRYAIVSESDLGQGVEKLSALHRESKTAKRKVVPFREPRS